MDKAYGDERNPLIEKSEFILSLFEQLVGAGGVSANSWLRQRAERGCAEKGWQLYMPPLSLTGDNAAMIGAQAYYEYRAGHTGDWSLNGLPTMEITEQF